MSVTVTIPSRVAHSLLRERGWRQDAPTGRWVSPFGVEYWQTDEALKVELIATQIAKDVVGDV